MRSSFPVRLLAPVVSPRTHVATIHVVLDFYVGLVVVTLVATALTVTASLFCTVVLVVPALWCTLLLARGVGRVERARLEALLGIHIPDPYAPFPGKPVERFLRRITCAAAWKELAYSLLLLPLAAVGLAFLLAAWCGSLALLTLPATLRLMPDQTAHFGLVDVRPGPAAWTAAAIGLLGLLVATWISRGFSRADAGLAQALLGRGSTAALEARVDTLEASRSWALEVAESERRRIERDLHDGAQQRLVALAMDLGMAQAKFDTDPDAARLLIDEAHAEAKRAIVELRDLARGIHPVALGDRGLAGAVPALASRCAIPVHVDVSVPERPTPSIEGMAYFIVSECLANAVKHSNAGRVWVEVHQAEGRLRIAVTDDGIGGAEPMLGSGLRGLADRATSVDGTFEVTSPIGGPTVIRVELPCAS